MTPMIGLSINNYQIRAPIGEGGMGVVYMAQHACIGRRTAIKILREGHVGDDRMVDLFVNEARAATTIRHPNIIDVLDVGRLPDGRPYLMMELLEGETLGDRLRRAGPLPLAEALEVVRQAAAGLGAAHAHGIVHQDLKPDNLFLSPDPDHPGDVRVKILDFGIAKLRAEPRPEVAPADAVDAFDDSPPLSSRIFGSPYYMSPEQCRGEHELIDHRTDVYAMGALLYHLLCGAPPFMDDTLITVLVMHMRQAPPPPRALNPAIPRHVEAAILRALAKLPDQRFDSMAALVEALSRQAARPVEAAPGDEPPRAAQPWKPAFIVLGAAVAMGAAMLWPPTSPGVARSGGSGHPGRSAAWSGAAAPVAAVPAPTPLPVPPPVMMIPPPERHTRPPRPPATASAIVRDDAVWGRRH
jgi:serine/threonine protein kinase